jgi:hypothetical protein
LNVSDGLFLISKLRLIGAALSACLGRPHHDLEKVTFRESFVIIHIENLKSKELQILFIDLKKEVV